MLPLSLPTTLHLALVEIAYGQGTPPLPLSVRTELQQKLSEYVTERARIFESREPDDAGQITVSKLHRYLTPQSVNQIKDPVSWIDRAVRNAVSDQRPRPMPPTLKNNPDPRKTEELHMGVIDKKTLYQKHPYLIPYLEAYVSREEPSLLPLFQWWRHDLDQPSGMTRDEEKPWLKLGYKDRRAFYGELHRLKQLLRCALTE